MRILLYYLGHKNFIGKFFVLGGWCRDEAQVYIAS